MPRKRTAVLISGRGSNLQALIEAAKSPEYPAQISLVISNVTDAEGLARARDARVPTRVISHKNFESREDFDRAVDAELRASEIEIVCLAGFMRILSDWFVQEWEGRLINIHPSLLPAYKGTNVHARVLAAKERVSGCTVHFVVPELDSGLTIAQAEVPVLPGDTEDRLAARILAAEHRLYPDGLRRVASGEAQFD
jgi:phosphoribosylglycinamide formyltransferase-1